MSNHICTRCGSIAEPRTHTPGSFFIEVLAWLMFLLPGLLYSMWRISARREVCPTCGAEEIVPCDTPRGRRLAADLGQTIPVPKATLVGAAAGRAFARMLKPEG